MNRYLDKYGVSTFVFDGMTTVYSIPINLGIAPDYVNVIHYDTTDSETLARTVTSSATTITITYTNAPAVATVNVGWRAMKKLQ